MNGTNGKPKLGISDLFSITSTFIFSCTDPGNFNWSLKSNIRFSTLPIYFSVYAFWCIQLSVLLWKMVVIKWKKIAAPTTRGHWEHWRQITSSMGDRAPKHYPRCGTHQAFDCRPRDTASERPQILCLSSVYMTEYLNKVSEWLSRASKSHLFSSLSKCFGGSWRALQVFPFRSTRQGFSLPWSLICVCVLGVCHRLLLLLVWALPSLWGCDQFHLTRQELGLVLNLLPHIEGFVSQRTLQFIM